ncbi:hypothetical protein LSAT2_032735 [Lamellibrachia satsuma]|nr:hypothetical protein LSAT2_032735 [Lamellibrachia satsuma]
MHSKECARQSLFQSPKRLFPALVRTDPPTVHLIAYVTGGLRQLYKTVQSPRHSWEGGVYTDADGCFTPTPNMQLLASRYSFLQVIGQGQSSVLIKAQDTFRGGELVSIKVLHKRYSVLGTQEADCIRRLNQADIHHFSATLRLYTMFLFDGHYCLVFELLHPQPLHKYFLDAKSPQFLDAKAPQVSHKYFLDAKVPQVSHKYFLDAKSPQVSHKYFLDAKVPQVSHKHFLDAKSPQVSHKYFLDAKAPQVSHKYFLDAKVPQVSHKYFLDAKVPQVSHKYFLDAKVPQVSHKYFLDAKAP